MRRDTPERVGCAAAMDVPDGFSEFEPQGPFLQHIGPVQANEDGVFGLRAEERHTNHRGTIQGGLLASFADFVLGRELSPGSTILVDKKEELTGEEGESLVDIRIVEGEPRAKVTVPPEEPEAAEPEEAATEE